MKPSNSYLRREMRNYLVTVPDVTEQELAALTAWVEQGCSPYCNPSHIADAFTKTGASAAIISSMLYSPKLPRNYHVSEIKDYLTAQGIPVRPFLK